MRGNRGHRKDNMHKEITDAVNRYNDVLGKYSKNLSQAAYERLQMTQQDTHIIGNGFPDVIIGIAGFNFLFEIKSTKSSKLTPQEVAFTDKWRGSYFVVSSPEEMFKVIADRLCNFKKEFSDIDLADFVYLSKLTSKNTDNIGE